MPTKPYFKDLTVVREFENGVRSESYHIGVVGGIIGGVDRDGRGSGAGGRSWERRFSVRWDSNRLVIETGSYSGPTRESGAYSEHTETWWLEGDSGLVMTVTDRSSDAELATRTLRYRRE